MKLPPLGLRHLWLMCPPTLVFILANTPTNFQPDIWWQLNHGRRIVETGQLIETDPFSHTIAGKEVTNPIWLAQVVFYQLYRLGDVELVTLAVACMYVAGFAIVTFACYRRGRNCRVAAICTLVAVTIAAENLTTRTQAFSFLFFSVEWALLLIAVPRWWVPWCVGGIGVLWTNTHGGFVLGIALPVLFLASRLVSVMSAGGWREARRDTSIRCLLACAVCATIASLCNPHPSRTYSYVIQSASFGVERNIQEWQPADWASLTGLACYASVVIAILTFNRSGKRLDATEAIVLLVFLLLSQRSARTAIWWGVVLAPILAGHMALFFRPEVVHIAPSRNALALNYSVAAYLLAAALLSTPWTKRFNPLMQSVRSAAHPRDEPYEMIEYLKQRQAAGNAFNPMEWGGYLMWHCDKRLKVFVDGRVDPFPPDVWGDYLSVADGREGWEDLLDRYQVGTLIASRRSTPRLAREARMSARWRQVYEDRLSAVYERVASDLSAEARLTTPRSPLPEPAK